VLCDAYNLDKSLPLYCFIGRLAHQKGADILIQAIEILLHGRKARANFIILGSGELALESALNAVALAHSENVRSLIKYDEKLSHQLYAGSDFLIMPSRFEPCGLNQMFAMRYGTIPIVRATGGLIDSVRDISQDGTGICFDSVLPKVLAKAINRGIAVFRSQKEFKQIRQKAGRQNFSWKRSMKRYAEEYYKLINI
jgi:starch synthase